MAKKNEHLYMSTGDLCLLFGLSKQRIQQYTVQGMPKVKHGTYDATECLKWYLDNIYSGPEDNNESIQKLKARLLKEQGDHWALKNEEKRQDLLPADEVKQQWADRAASLRGSLRGLISRLVGELEGKNRTDIRAILKREIDGLLSYFCEHKSYEAPKHFNDDDGAVNDAEEI